MDYSVLKTEFAGVIFSNPFIIASCPLTSDSSHILKVARAGWGAAVTKTITSHPQYERNLTPSIAVVKGKRGIIGLGNNEIRTHLSIEEWCLREIPLVKKNAPSDFILIGSIMESTNPHHWGNTAEQLQRAGVDMIEMNVSCSHGMPEKYMGSFVNDDPKLLEEVVTGCRAKIEIPLIVKLNSLNSNLLSAVNACIKGGADGISVTNTLLSLPSVNISKRVPNQPSISEGYSTFMGYSGTGIRPFGLYSVAQIANHNPVPVSGIGGIESWENSIEYFLVGATIVQICTAAMLQGLEIITGLKSGVANYLIECGAKSINQIRGEALAHLFTPENALAVSPIVKAKVIDDQCTVCNKCINPCLEGATAAISLNKGKIIINEDECIGCGLCIVVCPFHAITM